MARRPVRLTADNISQVLDSVDVVLSDCDGVIWNHNGPIPNAREGYERIKSLGKKILFVTNNTLLAEEKQYEKFRKFGYDLKPHEVCTPSFALAYQLRRIGYKKKMLVLATEGFKQVLRDAGVKVVDAGCHEDIQDISRLEEVVNPIDDEDIGAVVCDFDMNVSYVALMQAVHCLLRPECQFIVGCSEERVSIGTKTDLIGPASIARVLSDMTGREPTVIGKPKPVMIQEYMQGHHNIRLDRALFVGDSIHLDCGIAYNCGIKKRLLVLSGITKASDLGSCPPELMPEYIVDSVADFLKMIPPVSGRK